MTTKHTPGPWHFGVETIGQTIDHAANYICAANTNTIVCADIDSADDARLIAAAPDLLAALQELVAEWDWLQAAEDHRTGYTLDTNGVQMARAAIARATL